MAECPAQAGIDPIGSGGRAGPANSRTIQHAQPNRAAPPDRFCFRIGAVATVSGGMAMALLSVGSRGPEVVTLQRELNRQLFPRPNLAEDGIFGPLTQQAVRAFQRQAG